MYTVGPLLLHVWPAPPYPSLRGAGAGWSGLPRTRRWGRGTCRGGRGEVRPSRCAGWTSHWPTRDPAMGRRRRARRVRHWPRHDPLSTVVPKGTGWGGGNYTNTPTGGQAEETTISTDDAGAQWECSTICQRWLFSLDGGSSSMQTSCPEYLPNAPLSQYVAS